MKIEWKSQSLRRNTDAPDADDQRPSQSAIDAYGFLIHDRERLRLNMRMVAYSIAQAAWVGRYFKLSDGTQLDAEARETALYRRLDALANDPRNFMLSQSIPAQETQGCCLLGSHSKS